MTSPEAVAGSPRPPILVLDKLDKRFSGTHALKSVDLAFEEGEIHAIVGENGAGKSTLIKVLTAVHPRTSGDIAWQGKSVPLASPHESIRLGINAVHQEVVLCPHLTVAANIFLGDEEMRAGLLDKRRMTRDAQKLLDELGFTLPAGAVLSSLTIGQQQLVATARAERRGAKFLIFDEPTAYLTRQEAAALFKLIRRLKQRGVTIVYISHRLEEVFELCDRVSVLRDGALVGTRKVAETNEADLIALMINRKIEQIYIKDTVPIGATILTTEALTGPGFRDVSVTVREGEIVGLYGLVGAGRSEFVQSVFGRRPATGGRIVWRGEPVSIRSERRAMDLGIALSPESRRDQGLCLNLGVGLNINLPIFKRLSIGPLINLTREAVSADKQIRDVQIKTASRAAPVSSLSGGNQQKVVIGKWLNHGAKLFIFDEPTVGVDVGTKAEIYRLLGSLLRQGAGIIMISSYLPEVYELADTLHVFRAGRLVATHGHKDATHETILTEAIGV
ncbi:monosaccharide ABC transporter ATP-binding protein (CUT2 family) [Roseiarcus fermentans]|uniref:Monosaccharide ABC transporter ATP-binding protein (CUT2 family) n=1 Tax=Roseiarcus fermentans TaxID=1473586 RepID=A0A366FV91_9HYPH|nr:sugar ABC transporter ATP-binding protein [Roseiarcus fermentans]RBP17665.1 monosaccharide ABC transporter ATP-binding protein (CUT2 family) [Roseiarcus fermentans]